MQDLRFYNRNLELIAIDGKYEYSAFRICFNAVGTFEAKLPVDCNLSGYLESEDFIIVSQGKKQALITLWEIKDNEIILYGRTLNYILEKRYVTDVHIKETDDVNLFVSSLAEECFAEIEAPLKNEEIKKGSEMYFNGEKSLLGVIETVLGESGMGHRVYVDFSKKKWYFECLSARENNIEISDDNKKAYDMEIIRDISTFSDRGIFYHPTVYMGEWDAKENIPALSDSKDINYARIYRVSQGGTRFGYTFEKGDFICCVSEKGSFKKSSYISSFPAFTGENGKSVFNWESILKSDSALQAGEELAKKKIKTDIEFKTKDIFYEKDYFLGDIVTVKKKGKGKIAGGKRMVSGILICCDMGEYEERPEFEEVIE